MIGKYKDEATAFKRVDRLKLHGIWPGIRVYEDGSASLLYDPDVEAEQFRHDRKTDDIPDD